MKIETTATLKVGADMKGRMLIVEASDGQETADFRVIASDGQARVLRLNEPGHFANGAWQVKPVSIFAEPVIEPASGFEKKAVRQILRGLDNLLK